MKLNLLLLLIFTISWPVVGQGPQWQWAQNAGSVSNDYGNAVCTDNIGNVYVTGTFQGQFVTFGNFILTNSSTGSLDVFLVKYDATGNVVWATSAGGSDCEYGAAITTDTRE